MSQSTDPPDEGEDRFDAVGRLSEDDRELFERIRERHDGDDIEAICEAVLQSSATDSEEASS